MRKVNYTCGMTFTHQKLAIAAFKQYSYQYKKQLRNAVVSDKSNIIWTESTWNPITGCSVISAACKNCYAMKLAGGRLKHHPSRAGLTKDTPGGSVWTGEVRFNEQWLDQPLRWERPRKIFVCAHSDLFHESVPDEWVDRVFAVMGNVYCKMDTPHTFQVLTKRPERMRRYLSDPGVVSRVTIAMKAMGLNLAGENCEPHWPLPNVWLGVSVENQAAADERIPLLLQTPAAIHWVSMEPLLGAVDLERVLWPEKGDHRVDVLRGGYWCKAPYLLGAPSADLGELKGGFVNHSDMPATLDWVVVGGESGAGARPMHPDWVRCLRDQCTETDVPFLFKQWGEHSLVYDRDRDDPDFRRCDKMDKLQGRWINLAGGHGFHGERVHYAERVGVKAAGRLLDGVMHNGYPAAV